MKTINRAAFTRALGISLLLIFCAHAFCFFNPTYSGQSTMVVSTKGEEGAQFLLPLYLRLRGAIASPLLVGMLSALFLSLSAAMTCELLGARTLPLAFALCAAMTVNPGVTSVFAARLHTADAAFLAQLLSTLGVFSCMQLRFGAVPGAIALLCACALDGGAPACFAALALLAFIATPDARRRSLGALFALLAGAAMYAAACFLLMKLGRLSEMPALGQIGLEPIRALFAPLTAYPRLNVLLRAALALALAACLTMRLPQLDRMHSAATLAALLALPLAVCLGPSAQFPLAYAYLDMPLIALIAQAPRLRKVLERGAAVAFSLLLLGGVVFSNQVYLKKNLEYHATLSVMTRVLDRTERVEGYAPGFTPVAFAGTLDASALSVPHKGFEHLSALDAAKNNYAITSPEEMIWYCWQVLGYPLNFTSLYEMQQFAQNPEVAAMPAFPAEGCCRMIDGTLVIRLSE